MDHELILNAKQLNKRRRRKKLWQKAVSILGCIVVFCTTYALILPAITQEREAFCGLEEHIHGETCYSQLVEKVLVCTPEFLGIHTHGAECYDENGETVCSQTDFVVHTHNEDCYDSTGNLVCALEEREVHVHSEACYTVQGGHTHGEDCWTVTQPDLICQMAEDLGHTHTEDCYEKLTVCTISEGHTHGDSCYEQVLQCQTPEAPGHTHGDDCYEKIVELTCTLPEEPGEKVLTCNEPEAQVHIHVDACFQTGEVPLRCTQEEGENHTHSAMCYGTWSLVCMLEEHTHSLICYSDPEADVETAEDWEKTFADTQLTGQWAEDVLTIAKTQLDYRESTSNYIVEEGELLKGYTRYGAWYGIPYGDWCAMYASFCLHYAGVEGIPAEASVSRWITLLSEEEYDLYKPAGAYVPQPGDLVFFDWEQDGDPDHVGFVAELLEATKTEPLKIKTIEGNSANSVRSVIYDADDSAIIGFAVLPRSDGKVFQELTAQIYTDGAFQHLIDDGTVITVSGILPVGANVRAFPVELRQEELNTVCVYEIEIFLSDGSVYAHEGDPLVVAFDLQDVYELDDIITAPEVYYIPSEGEPEQMDTEVHDGIVSFETPHFSTYALVLPNNITKVSDQDALRQAITDGAPYIQLTGNFTMDVDQTLVINNNKNITIDLNGHTLTHIGSASLFSIQSGSLTVGDSVVTEETVSSMSAVTVDHLGAHVATATQANGKVTLEYYVTESELINGTKTGDTTETLYKHKVTCAGAIIANASGQPLFTVTGGTLTIDSGMYYGGDGRAIYQTGGTTNLNGGYICGFEKGSSQNLDVWGYDNVKNDFGGALWADNATIHLSGTVLAGNEAPSGGAIYVEDSSFDITGGVISGNVSTLTGNNSQNSEWLNHYGGGGIFVLKGTTLTMSGGYITNNRADSTCYFDGGGGILICGSNGESSMTISGGWLTGNEAASGGAIRTNWANTVWVDVTGGYFCANYARSAEGGALSINQNATAIITSGYFNNNRTDNQTHWGGGAIFGANGSKLYMLNILATDNSAGGFGGGVAGCSTGRVQILVEKGGAVYNNSAEGQHCSGSTTSKSEDRIYAYNDPVFMSNGYEDFFCALNSTVEGSMLGGYAANWQGSSDGKPVIVPANSVLQSAYVAGLTSNPSAEGIAAAQALATVYLNGNHSYTHGGGILANGYLVIGETEEFTLSSRIELTGSKALVNDDGEYLDTAQDAFKFVITDAYTGEVIANGTNEDDGTIVFDRRLPFNAPGTYTYLIREVAQDNATITYDTTVYRLTVTVETAHEAFYDGFSDDYSVIRHWHQVSNVLLEKSNGSEWVQVFESKPQNNEDGPIRLTMTGSATFTNLLLHYTDITAVKKWEGTTSATSVTVKLYRNEELYDTKVLSAANNWKYTWENLPIYNKNAEDEILGEYSYSVEEEPVTGYYSDYTVTNNIQLAEYWIPINYVSDSLVVGEWYLIVYQDSKGVNQVLNIAAAENQWLTTADRMTAQWGDSHIKYNGQEITTYFPMNAIDERSIFRAMEEDRTHDGKQGIMLYNMGAANALLIEQSGGNYLKVPSYWGLGEGWVSLFTYDGTKLYGHYQGTLNGTYTIIYEEMYNDKGEDISKFDADPNQVINGLAQLYTLVTAGSAGETVVTITNRPVETLTYELNITKVNAWDSSVKLAGAEFRLSDSNGNVLTFQKESEGSYIRSDAAGAATVLVTNSGGKLVLKGLLAGEYTLTETKAPSGYLPVEDQTVILGGDGFEGLSLALTVADLPDGTYVLPETGGVGTIPYTMAGLALMVSALCLRYIPSKRRKGGKSS